MLGGREGKGPKDPWRGWPASLILEGVHGFWIPTYTHPNGPSEAPHYAVEGCVVYPAGHADAPWFRIAGEWVYPAAGHPAGESGDAWYELIGSFVYPTSRHPGRLSTMSPVYRVADET